MRPVLLSLLPFLPAASEATALPPDATDRVGADLPAAIARGEPSRDRAAVKATTGPVLQDFAFDVALSGPLGPRRSDR
jgi:hypothetical protein